MDEIDEPNWLGGDGEKKTDQKRPPRAPIEATEQELRILLSNLCIGIGHQFNNWVPVDAIEAQTFWRVKELMDAIRVVEPVRLADIAAARAKDVAEAEAKRQAEETLSPFPPAPTKVIN